MDRAGCGKVTTAGGNVSTAGLNVKVVCLMVRVMKGNNTALSLNFRITYLNLRTDCPNFSAVSSKCEAKCLKQECFSPMYYATDRVYPWLNLCDLLFGFIVAFFMFA